MKFVTFLAFASGLALAACNAPQQTTDNMMVREDDAVPADEANFNDEAPVIEDVTNSPTEAVTVAAVPVAPSTAPAAEIAPLADANAIEQQIRSGTGIERIRYGDGWAWTRNGRIVRVAGRDGREVAYFRPGEPQPFFVQRDGRAWGYRQGQVIREFDREGRPRVPDAKQNREAEEAAREARNRRAGAEEARALARRPRGDRAHRGDPSQASTTPSPSPTTREPRGDRESRHDARGTPTPAPSASPTGRWRRPERTPTREPGDG